MKSGRQTAEQIGRSAQLTIDIPRCEIHSSIHSIDHLLICTENIPEGTLVLTCTPLMRYLRREEELKSKLHLALLLLSSSDLQFLMKNTSSLYPRTEIDIRREIEYRRILNEDGNSLDLMTIRSRLNSFRGRENWSVLYKEASEIDHSCSPNCSWKINDDFSISIRTLREVKSGEELTVSRILLKEDESGYSRRKRIRHDVRYHCTCELCKNRCHKCDILSSTLYACSSCHIVPYCSKECQTDDWKEHEALCRRTSFISSS